MSPSHPLTCAALLAVAACGSHQKAPRVVPAAANAPLINAAGHPVGTASVLPTKAGGLLVLKLRHIAPGAHGVHLHATGACDPPGFGSAGPHYDPGNREHGVKNPRGPHLGDLPNISARPDSSVDTTLTVSAEFVRAIGRGGASRALVVHADPDDLTTSPSGNSGARIACGVLER